MSWRNNEIISVSASKVKFLDTAWIILAPSPWSEKIRMDDIRATVPYVFNSCNLSFGLINFISEHILYKYLIKKNLQGHLTRYRHFIHFITRI